MAFFRQRRRGIALLTAVLLFLCQSSYAVEAGASVLWESAPGMGACHESAEHAVTGHSQAPQAPAAHSICDAPKAVSESVQAPLLSIAQLPSLLAPLFALAAVRGASISEPTHANPCRSPPLPVLLCRLLN